MLGPGTSLFKRQYETFLRMKALAIPRAMFEVQPDVQTAVANSRTLAENIIAAVKKDAATTPLVVEDMQITNYDWPESITKAQEALVQVQLKEATERAQVRADLERARGQLGVEEAKKLIELKKAEAVAESIDIVKSKLSGAPEYLMWHLIRVMGEAALGPNNSFIMFPYGTNPEQINQMMGNANLTQMVDQLLRERGIKPVPEEKVEQHRSR